MSKYQGLTSKELISRLTASDKQLDKLGKQNEKLAALVTEMEPALAQANEQVEQLRSAVDNSATEVAELRKEVADANKFANTLKRDFEKSAREHFAQASDLTYETERRVSAENKLFQLEKKVLELTNSHLTNAEVKAYLPNLRIDRHGSVA